MQGSKYYYFGCQDEKMCLIRKKYQFGTIEELYFFNIVKKAYP